MSNGTSQIVIITGNIGQDHELKVMPNQNAVLNFSLATSESWKDSVSGQTKTETEWHRCVIFGRRAENTAQYTGKGSKIQVTGKLKTRKWTDNNNVDRYSTEVMVNDVQFLDKKPTDQTATDSSHRDDFDIPNSTSYQVPAFEDDIPA